MAVGRGYSVVCWKSRRRESRLTEYILLSAIAFPTHEILFIVTHYFVGWSVCRLAHLCALLKAFDGFRWHLWGPVTLCHMRSLTLKEGKVRRSNLQPRHAIACDLRISRFTIRLKELLHEILVLLIFPYNIIFGMFDRRSFFCIPVRGLASSTIDADEVARFDQFAAGWWHENTALKTLNRLRVPLVRDALIRQRNPPRALDTAIPLSGMRVLDVGCGGGILSEVVLNCFHTF